MLKKEIRILGLSASSERTKKVPVVGVVFRGSLWLDGVFTCLLEPGRRDYLSDLARSIRKSKQYSQVHAVILAKKELLPDHHINISALFRKIRLPVILVMRKDDPPEARGRYPISVRGRPVYVRVQGMSYERAAEVFSVGCAGNHRIPEAVRVADLVASRLA